jgi:hypothetical protein
MNNPDHISESLETIFCVEILEFFDADPGPGMEKIWIRDGKNLDPGFGINISDPQHCSAMFQQLSRSACKIAYLHATQKFLHKMGGVLASLKQNCKLLELDKVVYLTGFNLTEGDKPFADLFFSYNRVPDPPCLCILMSRVYHLTSFDAIAVFAFYFSYSHLWLFRSHLRGVTWYCTSIADPRQCGFRSDP